MVFLKPSVKIHSNEFRIPTGITVFNRRQHHIKFIYLAKITIVDYSSYSPIQHIDFITSFQRKYCLKKSHKIIRK